MMLTMGVVSPEGRHIGAEALPPSKKSSHGLVFLASLVSEADEQMIND